MNRTSYSFLVFFKSIMKNDLPELHLSFNISTKCLFLSLCLDQTANLLEDAEDEDLLFK